MKNWIKIGAFFILLILLTAEECSETRTQSSYEERQAAIYSRIENEFEKKQLGTEELKAFESRSLQMFTELIDYINICTDTSLSKQFRTMSREMLSELFVSEIELDVFLDALNLTENEQNEVLSFEGNNIVHFNLVSHSVSEKFTKQSDKKYSGSIRFELSSENIKLSPDAELLEVWLQYFPKQFGENTAEIWEIFFGRVK